MAARTSTSVGVGATITILAVATLGLFVTSMIFYAQRREALNIKGDLEKTTKDFVSDTDRNDPVVTKIKEVAKPGSPNGKTVLRYAFDERRDLMQKVTGNDRDTMDAITAGLIQSYLFDQGPASPTVKALEAEAAKAQKGVIPYVLEQRNKPDASDAARQALASADSRRLLSLVRERESSIDSLQKRVDDAEGARNRALQDKENESKRVTDIEKAQQTTVAELQKQVDITRAESEALREGINGLKATMDKRVDDILAQKDASVATLRGELDKFQAERAVDKGRIKTLEEQIRGTRYVGQSEYALVDGIVVASNGGDRTVTLNIGRKQRVVIGLSFNVYSQGAVIRPDDKSGDYPAGKATLEVIRVEDNSSIARILREQRGNPVVKGDIIANPIFDPAKKYKFLVFGNFDPQRTGNASAFGANEVKAWIRDWGGDSVDALVGDVDFIVLGERPQVPPQPPSSAPIEVINFNLDQQRIAQKYDELFKQATDTAIPVLNENRLRTLLGR
jgi:hypothetical protein